MGNARKVCAQSQNLWGGRVARRKRCRDSLDISDVVNAYLGELDVDLENNDF